MLQRITNKSRSELTLEVKTLDRTKGNIYILLASGKFVDVEENKISDQIRVLARDKISRPALVSIVDCGVSPEETQLTEGPPVVDGVVLPDTEVPDDTSVTHGAEINDGFICPACDREFDTERGLNVHIRSHDA